ncbi:MAG: hypothetical protein HC890_14560 [Chloroflexaceae bacterium]|nr:hypothetical protein [Chloroflexaceae bacterium]
MEVRIIQPLADLSVIENAADSAINLIASFDDPFTTGLVARFELFDTSFGNGGITNVVLFDQPGEGAPISVENFINYVEDGDYVNSIIHRSVPGFVVQGGGFTINNFAGLGPTSDSDVPTDPPILNEFSANRSNLRGTLAYARLGGDVNSATSQWFFNLSDTNTFLDGVDGGFTVFGEVLSEEDLETIDAIAALPVFDGAPFFQNGALNELPLIVDDPQAPVVENDDDFVRYSSITVSEVDELSFEVVSNSNPTLVTVTIAAGELVLDYQPGQSGTAELVIRATNLLGDTNEDTFTVTVTEVNAAPTFTSSATFAIAENETTVGTVTATDAESNPLTFSLSGGQIRLSLRLMPVRVH